jgi:hypothetical protein
MHQNTNQSQIPISNDQYIHFCSIALLRNPGSAGDDTVGTTVEGLFFWNFFEIWFLVLGSFMIFANGEIFVKLVNSLFK